MEPVQNDVPVTHGLKDLYDRVQERKLRAYSKVTSPEHVNAVRIAFDRWVKKMWGDNVVTSTPLRHPHLQLREPVLPGKPVNTAPQLLKQQLQATAVRLSAVNPETRQEKKRKIQLEPIPE